MRRSLLFILSTVLLHACAGDPPIDPANFPRATDGKADELFGFDPTLSCSGLCDADFPIATMCGEDECGPSDGYCFCDAICAETGDCCDDYIVECTSGPESLCEETGGVFEDEECACAQDGASADYVFTSLGCLPPDELCDRTGGVFEDGECGCVQDGASANYVFSFPDGCVDQTMLCEDTGGVFEEGECDCVQDAASTDFSFEPLRGGCVAPEMN